MTTNNFILIEYLKYGLLKIYFLRKKIFLTPILLIVFFLKSCVSIQPVIIRDDILLIIKSTNDLPLDGVNIKFYNDEKIVSTNEFGISNKKGEFFFEKVESQNDYRIAELLSNQLARKIILSKKGYVSDTIQLKNYLPKNKIVINDTLVLRINLKKSK